MDPEDRVITEFHCINYVLLNSISYGQTNKNPVLLARTQSAKVTGPTPLHRVMQNSHLLITLTDSQMTIFLLFQTADKNFRFDENGRKFSKKVENTEGKGEISSYKHFLLFQQFQKDLYCRHIKTRACLGKG